MLSKAKYISVRRREKTSTPSYGMWGSSNDGFKNYCERRINQRSVYLAKNVIVDCSYAKSFTPRQKFAYQAMSGKIFLQLKFHTCIHTGEKTRVCHQRNKRFFHANAQHKHYTVHIGIDKYTYMRFVCDDSFVLGI